MASARHGRLASGLDSGKPVGNRTLIELWSSIDASAATSAALHQLTSGRHRLGIFKRQITRRSLDFVAAIHGRRKYREGDCSSNFLGRIRVGDDRRYRRPDRKGGLRRRRTAPTVTSYRLRSGTSPQDLAAVTRELIEIAAKAFCCSVRSRRTRSSQAPSLRWQSSLR